MDRRNRQTNQPEYTKIIIATTVQIILYKTKEATLNYVKQAHYIMRAVVDDHLSNHNNNIYI